MIRDVQNVLHDINFKIITQQNLVYTYEVKVISILDMYTYKRDRPSHMHKLSERHFVHMLSRYQNSWLLNA